MTNHKRFVLKLPPTSDPRCGTYAGYLAHWRRGEQACQPCAAANAAASAARRSTPEGLAANRARSRAYRATPEGLAASRAAARAYQAARRAKDGGAANRAANAAWRAKDGGAAARAARAETRRRLRLRTPEQADADFARLRPGGQKMCRGCGQSLAADAFSRQAGATDGRQAYCLLNNCSNRHWKLKRDRKLRDHWLSRGIDPTVCLYCLARPAEELEHVFPKVLHGSDDFSNLAPACILCNRGPGGKHDRHPVEWLNAVHPDRTEAIIALFPHIKKMEALIREGLGL